MPQPVSGVRFDDLIRLRSLISDEFGPWSDPVRVPQESIATFADLTGDHQWIHVDTKRAANESPFGTTIAHGFLILALSAVIKSSSNVTITGHANALNYGLDRVRFVAPVPAGASIHGRTRVVCAEHEKGGTMITMKVAIHQVGIEKPSLCFDWKLLYRG